MSEAYTRETVNIPFRYEKAGNLSFDSFKTSKNEEAIIRGVKVLIDPLVKPVNDSSPESGISSYVTIFSLLVQCGLRISIPPSHVYIANSNTIDVKPTYTNSEIGDSDVAILLNPTIESEKSGLDPHPINIYVPKNTKAELVCEFPIKTITPIKGTIQLDVDYKRDSRVYRYETPPQSEMPTGTEDPPSPVVENEENKQLDEEFKRMRTSRRNIIHYPAERHRHIPNWREHTSLSMWDYITHIKCFGDPISVTPQNDAVLRTVRYVIAPKLQEVGLVPNTDETRALRTSFVRIINALQKLQVVADGQVLSIDPNVDYECYWDFYGLDKLKLQSRGPYILERNPLYIDSPFYIPSGENDIIEFKLPEQKESMYNYRMVHGVEAPPAISWDVSVDVVFESKQ